MQLNILVLFKVSKCNYCSSGDYIKFKRLMNKETLRYIQKIKMLKIYTQLSESTKQNNNEITFYKPCYYAFT